MSATSFNVDVLACHSVHLRAGVKKAVKVGLSRSKRRKANTEVAGEASSLRHVEQEQTRRLEQFGYSQAGLDAYADWLLESSPVDDSHLDCYDDEPLLAQESEDGTPVLPLYLQGSLPDWMLNELAAANGDAFRALSLFEAKRLSPKAAISMEDEAQYA